MSAKLFGILWDRETLATLADICERHGALARIKRAFT